MHLAGETLASNSPLSGVERHTAGVLESVVGTHLIAAGVIRCAPSNLARVNQARSRTIESHGYVSKI